MFIILVGSIHCHFSSSLASSNCSCVMWFYFPTAVLQAAEFGLIWSDAIRVLSCMHSLYFIQCFGFELLDILPTSNSKIFILLITESMMFHWSKWTLLFSFTKEMKFWKLFEFDVDSLWITTCQGYLYCFFLFYNFFLFLHVFLTPVGCWLLWLCSSSSGRFWTW